MLVSDEEDFMLEELTPEESKEEQGQLLKPEVIDLSLNSVMGLSTSKTMKIKGAINHRGVIVLIDFGATHNLISLKLVHELSLPITPTTDFGVQIGTGDSVKGQGLCKEVVLNMQNLTIIENFLPLELGGIDVILGMQWLETLGRFAC